MFFSDVGAKINSVFGTGLKSKSVDIVFRRPFESWFEFDKNIFKKIVLQVPLKI